ncbi:hypothetical protein ACHAW6_000331, partial [Cyclotella cf. meneghiniana]
MYDSRNKALNWISFEDPMQVNASFSNIYQRYVMAVLGYDFNPSFELDLPDWLSKKHECEWYGASCLDGKIIKIVLDCSIMLIMKFAPQVSSNLTGSLSPEISRLEFLQTLVLKDNSIEGTLPPEVSDMSTLKIINLNENLFSGNVPSSIGNLTELTQLDISRNQFTGSFPPSIGNLTELTQLYISENEFSG